MSFNSAKTLIERVLYWQLLTNSGRNKPPGWIVENEREDVKEEYKNLKSEDVANLRPDLCVNESVQGRFRREFSEELMKFDREVLGIK